MRRGKGDRKLASIWVKDAYMVSRQEDTDSMLP